MLVNFTAEQCERYRAMKDILEWRLGHAKYLLIYKKTQKIAVFLVLNIPFWVQNNRMHNHS